MLRLPKEPQVSFKGAVSFDDAGSGVGPILYPMPSLAAGLVAMLTHSALIESSKRNQKEQLQTSADKVLDGYRTMLTDYQHAELAQRGLRLAASKTAAAVDDAQAPGRWVVETAPQFVLTQDQRAIVLDNLLSFTPPGASQPAHQVDVRVVSASRTEADPAAVWTADQGERLKAEAAALFAESLDIGWASQQRGKAIENSAPHRTFRYREGQSEKIERAQFVGESCGRTVARTLRGGYISFPTRPPIDKQAQPLVSSCAPATSASASNTN